MAKSAYLNRLLKEVEEKNADQPEFIQAAQEVLNTLDTVVERHPEYEKLAILERILEPERTVMFRVLWADDQGKVQVNRGYRIQYNSAIGPYKGGLRFHPSVNLSIMKFLGFEQNFKNCLTGLPMGGGKGGSDFNPRGKSEMEVMRFCQAYMTELYRHIGQFTDVPAGDIGVGAREIGYMYGQYRRITNEAVGVLTGKGLSFGGSLGRPEATGYGVCYFADQMLRYKGTSFKDKRVLISGSGNVAYAAACKATELGGKVITMSDSDGYIIDEAGINLELIQEIKFVRRGRIKEYLTDVPQATYVEGRGLWVVKGDVALPCATQNELLLDDAKNLVKNGCKFVIEGANMPTTLEATEYLQENGVFFAPGKASNAGGVAVSGLEMTQNSERRSWSFEQVDSELKKIMVNIFKTALDTAAEYGAAENLVAGANIAALLKIANAMIAQGVV